ncbi:hypothetical protein PT2222_30005 [Paraburkholderia tropica]|nr:hypothetical protein [Paraburkholderia tropica]
MRLNPLGRTGLFVSELCLGTMTFGGGAGIWNQIGDLQQADAERLVGPDKSLKLFWHDSKSNFTRDGRRTIERAVARMPGRA